MASDQVMTTAFVLMIARFPFSRFWPSFHHRGSLKRGLTLHSTRTLKFYGNISGVVLNCRLWRDVSEERGSRSWQSM